MWVYLLFLSMRCTWLEARPMWTYSTSFPMGRASQEIHPEGFTGNVDPDRTGSSWQRLSPHILTWWSYSPLPSWGVAVRCTEISAHLLVTNDPQRASLVSYFIVPALGMVIRLCWCQAPLPDVLLAGYELFSVGFVFLLHFQSPLNIAQNLSCCRTFPVKSSSDHSFFSSKLWSLKAEFQLTSDAQKALLLLIVLWATKLILKENKRETSLF